MSANETGPVTGRDYRQHLIDGCDMGRRPGDGEFSYWLPSGSCLSAEMLRIIADELDARNGRGATAKGHTPGPWSVENDCVTSEHGDVARVHYQSSREKNGWSARADADLIAAAPDLLRGCRAAIAYLIDPRSEFAENREEAARIIQAAVAKAKT